MLLIFSFSNQPATESDGLSRGVTTIIIEAAERIMPYSIDATSIEDSVARFNHIVRKMAHFSIYFILGILVVNSFDKSKISNVMAFKFSIIYSVTYAMTDEFHQLFVPGRGAQLKDVLIDSLGALLGIMFYVACKNSITKLYKKRKM